MDFFVKIGIVEMVVEGYLDIMIVNSNIVVYGLIDNLEIVISVVLLNLLDE